MAIQKVTGEIIENNLLRNASLAVNTDLLFIDVVNDRIGINTSAPGVALDVTGTARITNDLIVQGNLDVEGQTSIIDTVNLEVEDPVLLLGRNNSGTDIDLGIMMNRGGQGNNAVFYWNEGDDTFRMVTSTSGSDATAIADTAFAPLEVGKITVDSEIIIEDNEIRTSTSNANLVLSGNSGGSVVIEGLKFPTSDGTTGQALVTDGSGNLSFADMSGGGDVSGHQVELGDFSDSSTQDGALLTGLGSTTTVTDAVDALNEALLNVNNNTFVRSVDFETNVSSGGLNLTVTLTITVEGNANRYTIDWGDGSTDVATSDSTPSHTYTDNTNSPYNVTVTAFNSARVEEGSAGSEASTTKNNFITAFTADPVAQWEFYAASSGGSEITKADSGSTIYMKNTSTNCTGKVSTYQIDWGDGTVNTISAVDAAGGPDGARLAHTYTNTSNMASEHGDSTVGTGTGDYRYSPVLKILTHASANPSVIPATSSTKRFYVYSAQTVAISVDGSTIRGINEESTSGFPVTFNNDTASNPGAYSIFNTNSTSNTYTWNFGEGAGNNVVQVGSGAAGDTGVDISNTFNLSSGQQSGGTTVTYQTTISLANGHSSTPSTADIDIIVEPDVRANLAGTAALVSTGSGDNSLTLYDLTDLDGTDRAIANFTNTSQNADNYIYDFFNDSSSTSSVDQSGTPAGSSGGAVLAKDYSGTSAGSIVARMRASGTPDTFFQDDEDTVTFTMKSTPSAPATLSSKSLTMSDSAQGTNPHLCASFTDNTSSFATQSAGVSCESTTVRRYTSGTIDTATVTNFLTNNSNGTGSNVNETITAKINNVDRGNRTMTTSEGGSNNSTFTSLVTTNHRDYDVVNGAYPQRLYLVATAKITQALTDYSIGLNAQRIESTNGGNTNLVYVVRDDITATPTTSIGTVAEGTAGSKRYISGIPYYNTGSPTVTITGTTIANFTGQTYQDTSSPFEVTADSNDESTSGNVLSSNPTQFTYANVDGASTMLSGGIPVTDTGVGSPYTIGAVTCALTSSSRTSVQTIKARSKNSNGNGSYNSSSTKIQLFTATPTALNNELGGITVADGLGATHDDDAVRIFNFAGATTDTPNIQDSAGVNYYTDDQFSGAKAVAGTREAVTRFGTIKHYTVDHSSGYLPVGPDLNTGRSGSQYYTFAFRRSNMASFNLTMSGKVSGMFIAAPGTAIDAASGLGGWLDCSTTYGGSGVPGSDTGNGGNGSNGCAFNSGDRVIDNTTYSSQEFTFTLGTENGSNARGNVILVRIKLESGDSVTALAID